MGVHPLGIFLYQSVSNSLVYRVKFSGISLSFYPSGFINPATGVASEFNMIVDSQIKDWAGAGIYGDYGFMGAALGNTIKQNVNAVSGSEGRCGTCLPNFPDEGPIRIPIADHLVIQYNDMFNNAGWSSGGLAHQPNIRLGTSGKVTKSVVADNLLEGGFGVMEMRTQSNSPQDAAIIGDVIIERNKFTATSNTMTMIDAQLGGATIRNNLFIKPNNGAPSIGTSTFDAVIRFSNTNTTPANLTYVNRIYNNTFISLAQTSAPNVKLVRVNNSFTLFDIYNNLVYAPFAVGGGDTGLLSWQYGASMVNVHTNNNLIFTPNNTTNYVWNNGIPEPLSAWQTSGNGINSLTSDPLLTNPNIFDATLQATSPAIDAGRSINGLMSDFNDKLRTAIPDIGALEF